MTGSNVVENRFVTNPLGSCTSMYEPFGGAAVVPEWHCLQNLCVPGSGLSLYLPPEQWEQGRVQPWAPAWADPRHEATRFDHLGLAPGLGSPWLQLCLPP